MTRVIGEPHISEYPILVVENRVNKAIISCFDSIERANASAYVLDETESVGDFDLFKKRYIHKSPNSEAFELICFRRYFLIKDFLLKREHVKCFFLLDSDVLIGVDFVSTLRNRMASVNFSGSSLGNEGVHKTQISPHVSFWTRDSIFDFVNFLVDAYVNRNIKNQIDSTYSYMKSLHVFGGISDMTLIRLWVDNRKINFSPINAFFSDGVVDHNISLKNNAENQAYKAFFGMKKLFFFNGGYYFSKCDEGKVIALAIHFQGKAKILMPYVLDGKVLGFFFWSFVLSFGKYLKRNIYSLRKKA